MPRETVRTTLRMRDGKALQTKNPDPTFGQMVASGRPHGPYADNNYVVGLARSSLTIKGCVHANARSGM